jgi:glyoxylase-like metal-dependent hydrolase (beta-lactamase superfamily II)
LSKQTQHDSSFEYPSESFLQPLTGLIQRQTQPELLGDEYRAVGQWPFRSLTHGSIIEKGGHRLQCYLTPGHSPGHICLYEPREALLFSGDIFSGVVQFLSDRENPVHDHLKSLKKLALLKPRAVLPGHRNVLTAIDRTIDQIERHHQSRNESIMRTLTGRSMDSYQVAQTIGLGVQTSESWSELSIIQKFFATRDCFAHLLYLESERLVMRKMVKGRIVYSLTA